MKDKFYIEDDSSDKKYFTIIPNYIANHSTANDQALYFQMKKHAGENGECFVSEKTLKLKLGIGSKALHKSIQYLLTHNWIKENGLREVQTKGGVQQVLNYKIVDIWKLNSEHYKGVSESEPLPKGCSEVTQGVPRSNQRGSLLSNKEELYNNIHKKEDTSEEASQINKLIDLFKVVNPSYSKLFANKTQRIACERMIKLHGFKKLDELINVLPSLNQDKYAPVITTPVQLEDKFGQLIAYGQKKQNNQPLMI